MPALPFLHDGPTEMERPRTADGQRPKLAPKRPSNTRNVSFTTGTRPEPSRQPSFTKQPQFVRPAWDYRAQRLNVDRHAQNVDPDLESALPQATAPEQSSYAIYDDSFAILLGDEPSLETLLNDPRAPFFYSGGTWIPRLSTLFLTSNSIPDSDPAAVTSGNQRTEITRLEIHGRNNVVRDKVRCPERSYMAAGCTVHPLGDSPAFIICAQGSLREGAGLVSIDAKRPHKTRVLLNNFHGRPFNSPKEIVTNFVDGCVYFTDPSNGYDRGFRHKPRMPAGHVYRFNPESGDCRVVADSSNQPAALAFSPDCRTLYVSEIPEDTDGTYIHAFDVSYARSSKAQTFNISVVPGTNHSHSASGSSNPSLGQSYRGAPAYATPESSPKGRFATLNGQPRSRSGSSSRDMSHHRFLTSPSRGPTSEPASTSSYKKTSAFLTNKRLFAYSPNATAAGFITTDPYQGDLWLGTEEGVEVWSATTGELTGKILVDEAQQGGASRIDSSKTKMQGVSKVVFINDSDALLLGGERMWKLTMTR